MFETEIHDALTNHTDEYEIVRELHLIRPHATYEVRFKGEHAVCKVETHPEAELGREAAAMQYVTAATSVPVPELLAVGDGHLVARWHDDVPDETPTRDEARIRALGHGLATLHAETSEIERTGKLQPISEVADPQIPPVDGDECWSDTLLTMLEDRAQYLERVGYGDLGRDVMAWVRANRDLFDAVDDTVLTHGNYFGEHVAVGNRSDGVHVGSDRDGLPATVIDFEHAIAAPAEWDYLRTVLPVFGPRTEHGVPESVFREAYESVRPLPPGFDRRRDALTLCNGLSYLRSLHLQRGDQDPPHAVARHARGLAGSVRDRLHSLRNENCH